MLFGQFLDDDRYGVTTNVEIDPHEPHPLSGGGPTACRLGRALCALGAICAKAQVWPQARPKVQCPRHGRRRLWPRLPMPALLRKEDISIIQARSKFVNCFCRNILKDREKDLTNRPC